MTQQVDTTDYKEKYKEALKVIEGLYNTVKYMSSSDALLTCQTIEKAFPELHESEDEKIRKELISFITDRKNWFPKEETKASWIAWLEKQKEFVSADFDDVWETADCEELTAPLDKYSKDAIKKMCHAWYDKGIELERRNWLEKQGEQKPNWCHHKVDLSNCSEEYRKAYYDGWNNCNQQHEQLKAEQKPWSEEDEKLYDSALWHIKKSCGNGGIYNWLKSLKYRVQPQPKQDWSEEDEELKNSTVLYIQGMLEGAIECENIEDIKEFNKIISWLKSIKPNHWKPSEEQLEALKKECIAHSNYQLCRLLEELEKL